MSIRYEDIDFFSISNDVSQICEVERKLGACPNCICAIREIKECIAECVSKKTACLDWEKKTISYFKVRDSIDDVQILRSICNLLKQCQSCEEGHDDTCVIHIIRNYLEQLEFGKEIKYEGNPASYLAEIAYLNKEKAELFAKSYMDEKKDQKLWEKILGNFEMKENEE